MILKIPNRVVHILSHRRIVSSCSLALCVRDVWSSRRRKYFSSHDKPSIGLGERNDDAAPLGC